MDDIIFDNWNSYKKNLNNKKHKPPFVKEGQIWWCTIGINIGYEMNGKEDFVRPVIILKKLSREMFLICPLTSKEKTGSWFVRVSHGKHISYACINQIKVIDYKRLRDMQSTLDDVDLGQVNTAINLLYKNNSARPEVGQPWEIPKYTDIVSELKIKSNESKNTIILEVPYRSQFLEVEDFFWNIRSCGGTCIKMLLDFYKIKTPSILEIMNEAFNHGGYDISNGFVHDFAVNYFIKNNLKSYRKGIDKNISKDSHEFKLKQIEIFNEMVDSIKNNSPVIVSIQKHTLEQNKFHLIVLTGLEFSDEGEVISIYYHEPERTDPESGKNRKCDIKTFFDNWNNRAIFCFK